ncbi:MAG: hypothetical protein R3C03_21575 [Pirellulaceae bacterium]
MTEAFEKALEEVKKLKNADEVAYADLIAECKLDGFKVKKSKGSKEDDEDDDGGQPAASRNEE